MVDHRKFVLTSLQRERLCSLVNFLLAGPRAKPVVPLVEVLLEVSGPDLCFSQVEIVAPTSPAPLPCWTVHVVIAFYRAVPFLLMPQASLRLSRTTTLQI